MMYNERVKEERAGGAGAEQKGKGIRHVVKKDAMDAALDGRNRGGLGVEDDFM